MKRVVGALNPKLDGFEASCFDGVYVTGDVSADELARDGSGSAGPGRRGRAADDRIAPGACKAPPSRPDDRSEDPARRPAAGLRLDTLAVREGLPPSAWGENSEALFLTSSFVQPDAATAAARFANEEEAFIYSRFTNPTVTMMERRLAALEGTEACIGTSSGMGAILMLVHGPAEGGRPRDLLAERVRLDDHAVRPRVRASSASRPPSSRRPMSPSGARAMRPNTKLLFAETPTNPLTEVCDIAALAEIAHGAGALLAVDNCFCSPALQRPVEFGADLVIHSGTKYLDGQGRVIAGALCARRELVNEKFVPVMRSAGMTLSPFNAWVVLKGLETLVDPHAGAERARAGAGALARDSSRRSSACSIPGLASHPQHALAMAQQSGCGGAVVSFIVAAGDGATRRARTPST